MKYLTKKYIKEMVAKDPRFGTDAVDWDEQGKAIIWLGDGWTWEASDGNRSVEGFIYDKVNCDNVTPDTVAYFKERLAMIEPVA